MFMHNNRIKLLNGPFSGDIAMKRLILLCTIACIAPLSTRALANSAPVVSNVTAAQRGDDSKLVDIYYDLADPDGDTSTVWVVASDDGGATWRVPALTFTGAIGTNVTPGTNKHIIWDAGRDMPGKIGNYSVRIYADDGQGPGAMALVPGGWFPYQNSGPPETWVFVDSFAIDKYEVTNQFYVQFLNNADPNGDHWDAGQEIDRFGDFGNYSYSVVPGRENYPIRYVNFYDAEAFAAWRSSLEGLTYRLPTEQEWEKAAGWDPVQQHHYAYGFHSDTIDCSKCNYNNCVGSPTIVGSYDPYKSYYGCYDMSGNVYEWTSSIYSGDSRVVRGGHWYISASYCTVTFRINIAPSGRSNYIGFRLVLDLD